MRVPSTLFATRNTRTNEQETFGLKLLGTADRIRVVRVSSIDDDIALLEVRDELLNEAVNSVTGLDEENDLARALELGHKVLDRVSANDVGA